MKQGKKYAPSSRQIKKYRRPGMMKREVHFKMPQRNIQDEEMMLRSRKFTSKRKKHFKMSKRNIQDKEMMLRSKEFSGTFLLPPPPTPRYRGAVPGSRGPWHTG